jgi:hypothetical protein
LQGIWSALKSFKRLLFLFFTIFGFTPACCGIVRMPDLYFQANPSDAVNPATMFNLPNIIGLRSLLHTVILGVTMDRIIL